MLQADVFPTSVEWYKAQTKIEPTDESKYIMNSNKASLSTSIEVTATLDIKSFSLSDDETYTCKFVFPEEDSSPEQEIIVVYARVTSDNCVFVDFRITSQAKVLTCTYQGKEAATSVTFVKPDSLEIAGTLGVFTGGSDGSAGSQEGTITLDEVTEAMDGTYVCKFALNKVEEKPSARTVFTARSKF